MIDWKLECFACGPFSSLFCAHRLLQWGAAHCKIAVYGHMVLCGWSSSSWVLPCWCFIPNDPCSTGRPSLEDHSVAQRFELWAFPHVLCPHRFLRWLTPLYNARYGARIGSLDRLRFAQVVWASCTDPCGALHAFKHHNSGWPKSATFAFSFATCSTQIVAMQLIHTRCISRFIQICSICSETESASRPLSGFWWIEWQSD
jgi:hypothetical protein